MGPKNLTKKTWEISTHSTPVDNRNILQDISNTFLSYVCLRKERRPSLRKLIIIPILIPQGGSIFTLHFRFCTTQYSAKSQLGVEISEGVHSYFQASVFSKNSKSFQEISYIASNNYTAHKRWHLVSVVLIMSSLYEPLTAISRAFLDYSLLIIISI